LQAGQVKKERGGVLVVCMRTAAVQVEKERGRVLVVCMRTAVVQVEKERDKRSFTLGWSRTTV